MNLNKTHILDTPPPLIIKNELKKYANHRLTPPPLSPKFSQFFSTVKNQSE